MNSEYYYGSQAEQFSFFRIPKILFSDEYKELSCDAKLLYGLLLDRMSLSKRNGWLDDEGRVYIIYPIEEIMSDINCADKKATKLLTELENPYNLIERKRQDRTPRKKQTFAERLSENKDISKPHALKPKHRKTEITM